jgi:hypothetical protein
MLPSEADVPPAAGRGGGHNSGSMTVHGAGGRSDDCAVYVQVRYGLSSMATVQVCCNAQPQTMGIHSWVSGGGGDCGAAAAATTDHHARVQLVQYINLHA